MKTAGSSTTPRNAFHIEIKEYKSFYASLREKVRSVGGYIAQEEQNESDYKIENTLVIKVPVDQFDNSIALLTSNVEKINAKKISSQDVTTEFVDTKSRMEAKKQVRQRYRDWDEDQGTQDRMIGIIIAAQRDRIVPDSPNDARSHRGQDRSARKYPRL